jgi:predicted MFS family arabinose efflux permease
LWVLAAEGLASVALIVTINVVGGFVQIVDSPARQAFISRLVTPVDLSSAVSLNGVVVNTARVVGPAVAGALIVTVGPTPCFAVNALSYVAVVIALLTVRPLVAKGRSERLKGAVRDGLRYARGRQQLWLPLLMMALVGLLAFNFAVIVPVLARKTFHGSGGTYGLMSALLSVGSVAGSFGVGLIRHPRRKLLVLAALAFGASLALTAGAPNVPLACAALVITGAAAFSFVTLASTTLQLHSSAAYRGRIMALWIFVTAAMLGARANRNAAGRLRDANTGHVQHVSAAAMTASSCGSEYPRCGCRNAAINSTAFRRWRAIRDRHDQLAAARAR